MPDEKVKKDNLIEMIKSWIIDFRNAKENSDLINHLIIQLQKKIDLDVWKKTDDIKEEMKSILAQISVGTKEGEISKDEKEDLNTALHLFVGLKKYNRRYISNDGASALCAFSLASTSIAGISYISATGMLPMQEIAGFAFTMLAFSALAGVALKYCLERSEATVIAVPNNGTSFKNLFVKNIDNGLWGYSGDVNVR